MSFILLCFIQFNMILEGVHMELFATYGVVTEWNFAIPRVDEIMKCDCQIQQPRQLGVK